MVLKRCRALVEFRLNTPNDKDGTIMRPGEEFTFDGFRAKIDTPEGDVRVVAAHSLKGTEGEWYEVLEQVEVQPQPGTPQPVEQTKRSAVLEEFEKMKAGNKTIENSQVGGDGPPQDLQKMVDNYDEQSGFTKNGVRIENDDQRVVAKTRIIEGSEPNTPSVQSQKVTTTKRAVVTEDQRLAKETNYGNNPQEQPQQRQKLPVVEDGQGVEVAKTSTPAIQGSRPQKTASERVVVPDGDVVKESTYEDQTKTSKVGSSTQLNTTPPKSDGGEKLGARAGRTKRVATVSVESQEGTVVAKTRKTSGTKVTADGIKSTVTVSGGDEGSVGEAVVGSGGADIEFGEEATFHAVEDSDGIDVDGMLEDV